MGNQSLTNKQNIILVNSNESVKRKFLKHCVVCNDRIASFIQMFSFLKYAVINRLIFRKNITYVVIF